MSLEHVSMWHESRGWVRTSVNQAGLSFSQSVSAHERMFICDLCHKHVAFVKGVHQVSHFKHNRGDPEKGCADRTQALAKSEQQLLRDTITNPIRIKVESNAINIEIGFLPIPSILLEKAEAFRMQVCVCADDKIFITKNINKSNFSSEETVFHSIGGTYFHQYRLQIIPNEKSALFPLHNREIPGLHPLGTLFDYQSGRIIPMDGDVEIGKPYYLLSKSYIGMPYYMEIKRVMSDESYVLYVVTAQKITKETTEFFFKFRCRLTAASTKLIPVWPIIHESEHYIETNEQQLCFLLEGDSSIRIEPSHLIQMVNIHAISNQTKSKLITIKNISRIRMLWAARLSVLRYLSLYYIDSETSLSNVDYEPVSLYTDDHDNIESGTHSSLPRKNRLYIIAKYDGKVMHRNSNGQLRYSLRVKADQTIMLERITWGDNIRVYYGMDVVADLSFIRSIAEIVVEDEDLHRSLLSCRGRKVPFTHRYKWLLTRISNMPKSKAFIQDALQDGYICSESLIILNSIMKEKSINGSKNVFTMHGSPQSG